MSEAEKVEDVPPPSPEFMELARQIRGLAALVRSFNSALSDHLRIEFTKAHPRNGVPDEVLQYLGLEHTQLLAFPGFYLVIVPQPAKDNRAEQTAEKVV